MGDVTDRRQSEAGKSSTPVTNFCPSPTSRRFKASQTASPHGWDKPSKHEPAVERGGGCEGGWWGVVNVLREWDGGGIPASHPDKT